MNYSEKISEIIGKIKSLSSKQKYTTMLLVGFFVFSGTYVYMHMPPTDFPLGEVITIKSGDTLQEIAFNLQKEKVIKSPFFFRFAVALLGGEKKLIAGDYLLDKREGPVGLAHRITDGDFHLVTFKATIPEGWSSAQVAQYFKSNLETFDKNKFLVLAKGKEGYLFPDTYFVSPKIKPEVLIEIMSKNFEEKIKSVKGLATSTKNLKDIIIMASILEEEARTTESRRMVAGILWKRLSLGMPLQVDSTFLYINGKTTYELTSADLKIDSPYNTYKYKGLPPTPISNPGLDAINSAVNPIESKYLYFLSSKSGKMYYATTFEQHKRNKDLYLNK
jgi:UPF0755 protein